MPIDPHSFQFWSLIVNLLMFLGFFLVSFCEDRSRKLAISLTLVALLSLVYGIRSVHVGIDSLQYATVFTDGSTDREDFEPMFIIISKVAGLFASEPQFFFVTIASLTNIYLLLGFRKLDPDHYPALFSLFLTSFLFINMNVNILRQGLAMAFAFYAVSGYLADQRKLKFVVFSFLALLTHATAFIFLAAFVASRVKTNRVVSALFVALLVLLMFVDTAEIIAPFQGLHWLLGKLYWYLTWPNLVAWKFKHFYYLIALIFLIFNVCVYHHGYQLSEKMRGVCKLTWMGFMVIAVFRADEMLTDRMYYYFVLPFIYLGYELYRAILLKKYKAYAVFVMLFVISGSAWALKSNHQYETWFVTKKAIR